MAMGEAPGRPLDIGRLFGVLERHGVEYLVIGGVAVQVHGHRRTTKDLDVMPAPGGENASRLAAALDDLEARVVGGGGQRLTAADAEQLSLVPVVPSLLTEHGELHVLPEPEGAGAWDAMRERALVVDLDGVGVAIVALDDLLRMKLAAGRPADLDDVAVLTALERRGS
jgi:hypothetical protein